MVIDPVPEQQVLEQLNRILSSEDFPGRGKPGEFLRYIVEETLDGNAAGLKGFTIALDVFERDEDFDPQLDPIVRITAGRLRRALERYYLTSGKDDPVLIDVPKGGYVPVFTWREDVAEEAAPVESSDTPVDSSAAALSPSEPKQRPTIAVLPLVNLSGDAEQDFFAYGLGEELSSQLSRNQQLQVISHYSMARYKEVAADLKQIGTDMGVEYLITGSILRHGDMLRMTMQLSETTQGTQLWVNNYQGQLNTDNLLLFQDEIIQEVLASITDFYGAVTLSIWKLTTPLQTQNLSVYDSILLYHYSQMTLTPEDNQRAFNALQRAVEIEPTLADAWAMLGTLHADRYAIGMGAEMIKDPAELARATECMQKAHDLDPTCPHGLYLQAYVAVLQKDRDAALAAIEQILTLNPGAGFMVGAAGNWLTMLGEYERGKQLLDQSLRLNPIVPEYFYWVYYLYHLSREEYKAALTASKRVSRTHFYYDFLRASVFGHLGCDEERHQALAEVRRLHPEQLEAPRTILENLLFDHEMIERIIAGLGLKE